MLEFNGIPALSPTRASRPGSQRLGQPERTAEYLRTFYDQAPSLKPPPKPLTWLAVALKLKEIYQRLLNVPVQF